MTKYILHGGVTSLPCESNDNYFKEIIHSVSGPVRILLVYFAVEEERWEELAVGHKKLFLAQSGDKKIEFTMASADPEEFAKQIGVNDALFIRGGDTPKLQRQFEKTPNFKELIKDKTVAGSSAGALVFAKYYYEQDYDQIFEGLDFLHVKMITHYKTTGEYAATSGDDKLKLLEDHQKKLPVYAIRETDFVVLEK